MANDEEGGTGRGNRPEEESWIQCFPGGGETTSWSF